SSFETGRSVPSCCVTSYWIGVSLFFSSSSEGFVKFVIFAPLLLVCFCFCGCGCGCAKTNASAAIARTTRNAILRDTVASRVPMVRSIETASPADSFLAKSARILTEASRKLRCFMTSDRGRPARWFDGVPPSWHARRVPVQRPGRPRSVCHEGHSFHPSTNPAAAAQDNDSHLSVRTGAASDGRGCVHIAIFTVRSTHRVDCGAAAHPGRHGPRAQSFPRHAFVFRNDAHRRRLAALLHGDVLNDRRRHRALLGESLIPRRPADRAGGLSVHS